MDDKSSTKRSALCCLFTNWKQRNKQTHTFVPSTVQPVSSLSLPDSIEDEVRDIKKSSECDAFVYGGRGFVTSFPSA